MKNLKIYAKTIENTAMEQIEKLMAQPAFADAKVRIMPDVHAGAGCVIGFTADLGDKVIPNIVGVDIGCGMMCVKLGHIDIDFQKLDFIIKTYVPSGMTVNKKNKSNIAPLRLLKCYDALKNKAHYLERSIGTLGGGNHFIEIDEDEEGCKYLVIHTGSRNLGKQVATFYQQKAIERFSYKKEKERDRKVIIEYCKANGKEKEIQEYLKGIDKLYEDKMKMPEELCYLEGLDREDYLHDMEYCQKYAEENRMTIANTILTHYFEKEVDLLDINCVPMWYTRKENTNEFEYFETIHNYINFNDNIVRKGAISAQKGQMVLIPMNMRDGCILGIGKGNEDWNCSAPHGAGRIMSRKEAKEKVGLEEFQESMEGIYTTTAVESTIDESPMAYKPMEEILEVIEDTVEIKKILKPIYNFKASE